MPLRVGRARCHPRRFQNIVEFLFFDGPSLEMTHRTPLFHELQYLHNGSFFARKNTREDPSFMIQIPVESKLPSLRRSQSCG